MVQYGARLLPVELRLLADRLRRLLLGRGGPTFQLLVRRGLREAGLLQVMMVVAMAAVQSRRCQVEGAKWQEERMVEGEALPLLLV